MTWGIWNWNEPIFLWGDHELVGAGEAGILV